MRELLDAAPSTSVELADLCGVSVRAMNARLQFYALRGKIKHNGRKAPRDCVGRRAMFWVLA